jgi:hypothetical protein
MQELEWNRGAMMGSSFGPMPGKEPRNLAETWISSPDTRAIQAGRPDTLPAWAIEQADDGGGTLNYHSFHTDPRDRWTSYAVDATLAMVLMVAVLVVW